MLHIRSSRSYPMTYNKTLIQFFEWYTPADGKHWRRFAAETSRLLSLGITGAWLPPAYKGTRGRTSEGYDVYDIYDLGEFDQKGSVATKYGTKEDYIRAVNYARSLGMQVFVDVVLNHMGGAEEIEKIRVRKADPDNRLLYTSDEMEIEAYTKFTFPGRRGKHSMFTWDSKCFTGVDYAADTKECAIFNLVNGYDEGWEPLVHNEKGSFDFLMLNDIETRNPEVRQELMRWAKWYYETVPFDGVRLDAVKHINPQFFIDWLDFLRAEVCPSLLAIGEYWLSDDLPVLVKYLDATGGRMSLFDAPLHHNLSVASEQPGIFDLCEIFTDSLVGVRPGHAITFVDNHDTQPLQSLEEFTVQWFKPHGYAIILLRKDGLPCVFYPDLYGTSYRGTDKDKKHREIVIPALDELPVLLQLRKNVAYGEQIDYIDHPRCIGWVRRGTAEMEGSGCAVLISNDTKESHKKVMSMGSAFARATMHNVFGKGEVVVLDETGTAEFTVKPSAISVWTIAK